MQATRFETKIAVALLADLEPWQKLNVTAFLVSGMGNADPACIGAPYHDGSGNEYLAMFVQPLMVYAATSEELRAAHARALGRRMRIAIYTRDLFTTYNDADNRAAVAALAHDRLDLVGIALRDARNAVDRVLGRLNLHS